MKEGSSGGTINAAQKETMLKQAQQAFFYPGQYAETVFKIQQMVN